MSNWIHDDFPQLYSCVLVECKMNYFDVLYVQIADYDEPGVFRDPETGEELLHVFGWQPLPVPEVLFADELGKNNLKISPKGY